MKYLFILWGLAALLPSCDLQKDNSDYIPLVPKDTPFIVGILEVTEDTVHHYPEVYVGRVSNPEDFKTEQIWITPGIWWPITNALVTRPVTFNQLKRRPDNKAKVTVKGPLNTSDERTVQFTHEGNGVYGDTQYQLPLKGGADYRLSVTMGDSRRYTATDRIPELFEWQVADSVTMELKLDQYQDGTYNEKNKEPVQFPFTVGPDVGYLSVQRNSEHDYYNLDVPEGGFMFDDRGDFLREGAAYAVWDAVSFPDDDTVPLIWREDATNPLRNSESWWLSVSQLSIPLSRFHHTVFRYLSGNDNGRWDKQDQERLQARVERDTTYLFEISNMLKVDENGEVLPEEQADAIGVFGGYSAAYRNVTVIPKRSWDPDTLNWGNQ